MKTALIIFIALCLPIAMIGQNGLSSTAHTSTVSEESRPDSLLAYAESMLSQRNLAVQTKGLMLYYKGKALYKLGEADAAMTPLQVSLGIAQKTNDVALQVKNLIVLGAVTGDNSNPDPVSSMDYLMKAKYLAESIKDTLSIARIYVNLSNLLYELENYEQAINNNTLCETLLKNTKFEDVKARNYYSKGRSLIESYINYNKAEDLVRARESLKYAIIIFEQLGKDTEAAHARNVAGGIALHLKDFRAAEQETRLSIGLGEALKDTSILINGYYNLANQYEAENDPEKAKDALNQLAILLESNANTNDQAFVTDQFSKSEQRVSVALVKGRADLFDKQIETEKSNKQKVISWLISVFLFISLIVGIVYYRQRNKLAEQNRILAEQKQKILEEELKSLQQAQKLEYMRVRSEGAEEGRHRIARQIHDGVGGLLVSAKWNLESALEELPQKESKVISRLNENLRLQEMSYKELRRVVYALEREDVPWWDYLQKIYQREPEQAKTKIQFYNYNLDRRLGGAFGEECRYIVQELITNAIKHAKPSEISVYINLIDDVLGIIVENNGAGFNPQEKMSSPGLSGIKERASKLGGSLVIESDTNTDTGTTVFVDIPIKDQGNMTENPLLYAGANR